MPKEKRDIGRNDRKFSPKRKQYYPTQLNKAFEAVQTQNISIHKASRIFKVPDNTLRRRVKGNLPLDTYKWA